MAVSYKNRIRSLRKKLKMTQEQMAEQLFIDQTTLSMYECGNRDIPVSIALLCFIRSIRPLLTP